MKYIYQFGIICVISFLAEVLHVLLPFPIPASIYGLVIMFMLLLTKVIKLEQVEEVGQFFITIMPLLFMSPSVSLMSSIDVIGGNLFVLVIMLMISTITVMSVTGLVAQGVIGLMKKGKGEAAHE